MNSDLLARTERLLGSNTLSRITAARVIIFGVGGVGSWCAEALVRSGIRTMTIVDMDAVSATNVNRQLMATTRTVGMVKVEVLKERLLDINPDAEITARQEKYSAETADRFQLERYDYVIDCIDSLKDKVALIMHATRISKEIRSGRLQGDGIARSLTFLSSMGAALRLDPTKVRVAEFWKVSNDSLARAIRRKLKQNNQLPAVKFRCVYSDEPVMQNKGSVPEDDTCYYKVQINGSLCHITAIFGMTLAGLVIQYLSKEL